MNRRALAALSPLALLCALFSLAPAHAASKVAIAAQGDPAPGGGTFAGPAFVGGQSAAGNGWVAYRTLVTDGTTTEQIVVTNVVTLARSIVANLGETVPEIGRLRQFLGRPTVNARGDVAFAAELTPLDGAESDPFAPALGGVFLWSDGLLSVVVAPGYDTGFGILDLTTPINLTEETSNDVAERTPALNDNGDVAFVASTLMRGGLGGGLFLKRAGQDLTAVMRLGDPYGAGTFTILGPPALNNAGTLAFRGAVVDDVQVAGDASLDGIFKLEGGTLSLLLRDGASPPLLGEPFPIEPLEEFGDVVALNEVGDVACTGGPIFDGSFESNLLDLEGALGVILIRNGLPLVIGFDGQRGDLIDGTITDVTLGPQQGSRVAPPALTADGQVIFFVQLNNNSSQAVMRFDPATGVVRPLVNIGGRSPDAAPSGGTFLAATSAPAVDAAGNVAFAALIAGSSSPEALVSFPVAGLGEGGQGITIGDAVPEPGEGYFGGPPFFPPVMNDAGDVVFRSYVARGPSVGIFRARKDVLEAIVRVGDVAPVQDGPRFSNLVGEPSVNSAGDIAFAGTLAGRIGRGIYVASNGALGKVAVAGEPLVPDDPARTDASIRTIAGGPSLSDTPGVVAFRGVVEYQSRFFPFDGDEREKCVFLADAGGVRVIAAEGGESGTGRNFLSFRDPTIRGRSVLFRATLVPLEGERGIPEGLFLADEAGVRPVAVTGQDLGGMTLEAIQSRGLFDSAGEILFSARVRFAGGSDGAILRSGAAGFEAEVMAGTPGPEGGRIQGLGRPALNGDGHVALRLGFEALRGGVPGIYLSRNAVLRPLLRNGESGPPGINGRITTLRPNIALNAADQIAVLATIGGGRGRNEIDAIFVAGEATLRVPQLVLKRGPVNTDPEATPKPRDRLAFVAEIDPAPALPPATSFGEESETVRVRPKPVTVVVSDTIGPLWTGTLARDDTKVLRGRTLVKRGGAESRIGNLRVKFASDGGLRLKVKSRPFDLSTTSSLRDSDENGAVVVDASQFSVRVDVGEEGASAVARCRGKGRIRCRSR